MSPDTLSLLKGYRKVIVTLCTLVASTFLAFSGKLTGDFASIAIAGLVGFTAANAYEHHTKANP